MYIYLSTDHIFAYFSLRWFFGKIKRIDAEKQLMQSFNQQGSFLVGDSETMAGDYTLSVRDTDRVRHYRIQRIDTGGFFVTRRVTFETIQELVEYYKQQGDGLCLKHACLLAEKPQMNEEWEIDRRSIRFVRKLGAGHFCEVWEGLWNTKTPVAVKTLKSGTMPVDDFLQEASILMHLRHPKIIQLYAVCTKEEPIYIVFELMKYGSLLDYLRGKGRRLNIQQLVVMSAQVAEGMAYLELQCCIHRELMARNILVGDILICKVADFRTARVISEGMYKAHTEEKVSRLLHSLLHYSKCSYLFIRRCGSAMGSSICTYVHLAGVELRDNGFCSVA